MKPLQRYDGHRSHVKNERMKRMLQLIDRDEDFESWKRKNLEVNWHGIICRERKNKNAIS